MSKRRDRLKKRIHKFLDQYARKRQRGREPNDRQYDRAIEDEIKRMSPEELDALIRDDEDGDWTEDQQK